MTDKTKLDELKEELDKAYFAWFSSGLGDRVDWDRYERQGEHYQKLKEAYEELLKDETI